MTPALKHLLDLIGSKEAPKGYGQVFGGAKGVGPVSKIDVSKMTLDQVRALQAKMVKAKSISTACGRYQFIRKTFNLTITEMNLAGNEVWNVALQDRMAVHLLKKRGLKRFLAGTMTREAFGNSLAAEWASLPMVSGPKKGRSYYDGDGINKAHHKAGPILTALDALRAESQSASDPRVGPSSPSGDVRDLQRLLEERNYNPGKVDGKWGKLTAAAVLALKSENGLDTGDPSILLSEAQAAPVRVIETRQDATVSDLRKDGSDTIKGADGVQAGGAIAGGVGAAGAVVQGTDALGKAEEISGTAGRWLDVFRPFQDFLGLIGDWWWVMLPIGGGAAIYFAHRAKKKRLEEFKTGKMG